MATISQTEACTTSFESAVASTVVSPKKILGWEPDPGATEEQTTPSKQKRRRRRSLSFLGSSSEEEVDLPRTVRRKCSVNYYESDSCSDGEGVLERSSPAAGGLPTKVLLNSASPVLMVQLTVLLLPASTSRCSICSASIFACHVHCHILSAGY